MPGFEQLRPSDLQQTKMDGGKSVRTRERKREAKGMMTGFFDLLFLMKVPLPSTNYLILVRNSSKQQRDSSYARTSSCYSRGGTPIFTGVFEPLARVALYPTDEDGLGTRFAAA